MLTCLFLFIAVLVFPMASVADDTTPAPFGLTWGMTKDQATKFLEGYGISASYKSGDYRLHCREMPKDLGALDTLGEDAEYDLIFSKERRLQQVEATIEPLSHADRYYLAIKRYLASIYGLPDTEDTTDEGVSITRLTWSMIENERPKIIVVYSRIYKYDHIDPQFRDMVGGRLRLSFQGPADVVLAEPIETVAVEEPYVIDPEPIDPVDDVAPIDAAIEVFVYMLIIGVLVTFYLLPCLIGYVRHLPHRHSLFVINLLLGWTLLAWALCWAWALRSYDRPQDTPKVDPA